MIHYPEVDAGIAAIEDQTLSPQQAADEIAKQCKQFIGPAPTRGNPTPDDEAEGEDSRVEGFFWPFWSEVLRLAQEDVSIHDRIAHILAALKAKGSEGCEGWKLWGHETDWSKLPVFGLVSREEMNGPQPVIEGQGFLDLTAPKAQALLAGDAPTDDEPDTRELVRCRKVWLNTNAFLARLWALDVWDGAFLGIASMRMHLEPLTLSSTSGPTATVGRWRDGIADPEELQIEVAALWLRIAGAKMYTCREIMGPKGNPDWRANRGCPGGSGGTWNGVDGHHPDRWKHWKGILQEVAKGSWRRTVIEAAQAAVEAMEKYEREAASDTTAALITASLVKGDEKLALRQPRGELSRSVPEKDAQQLIKRYVHHRTTFSFVLDLMGPETIPPSLLSPVERALRDSLHPPDCRNVHLYAFSRKTIFPDCSIQIDHPLPIFAVGSILKDTEHFSKLLTSGFAEASTDGQNTIRQRAHESEYDYPSDSDLDEFEELEGTCTPVASSSSGKGKLKEETTDAPESASTGKHENGEKFHQVLIPSIAYRTLMACVFYLYTDRINFLPLRSKGPTDRQFALLTTSDTLAPPCSPKSIYRLAEAYGITKLQDLAYNEIISQLNPRNIVPEAFCSFFARYDRLREHAVSYLSQNYYDLAVQEALPDFIDRFALGDLPHAGGVLRSLLGLRIALAPPSLPPVGDE